MISLVWFLGGFWLGVLMSAWLFMVLFMARDDR